ncbi:hypothetical protein OB919_15055 [Halobacteria archaeon AArc-curdl1]|uniref:Uncharacterized protein n=1 Tax=Natronosalvus hydrolyticus TaxID=2979988 RepID=A0AAP3E8H5_9EURY|nr:hypothetical protein [Halobacteria archaeon AArc-curdl1]
MAPVHPTRASEQPPTRYSSVPGLLERLRLGFDPLEGGWRGSDSPESTPETDPLEQAALSRAVETLFRPVESGGFWDQSAGHFVPGYRLRKPPLQVEATSDGAHTSSLLPRVPGFRWCPQRGLEYRNGPLATMAAMRWRVSPAGTGAYDSQLQGQLAHCRTLGTSLAHRDSLTPAELGALLEAFSLASDVLDPSWLEVANVLFDRTRGCALDRPESGLVLVGWAALAERCPKSAARAALTEGLAVLEEHRRADGSLGFDDAPHAAQQFTNWGLARAAQVLDRPPALGAVEHHLEHTVEHRMRADGALFSTDPRRAGFLERSRAGEPPEWRILKPISQALFITTIDEYVGAGGLCGYDRERAAALRWLWNGHPGGDLETVALDPVTESGQRAPPGYRTVSSADLAWVVAALAGQPSSG